MTLNLGLNERHHTTRCVNIIQQQQGIRAYRLVPAA